MEEIHNIAKSRTANTISKSTNCHTVITTTNRKFSTDVANLFELNKFPVSNSDQRETRPK
jgi:hypothetical protein